MKTKVIAAIDNSEAAAVVLSVAQAAAATLFEGDVEAFHVREDGHDIAARAADKMGISLRFAHGPTVASIVEAAGEPEVAAVVLGSRSTLQGPRPAGHAALEVMTSVGKPLLAVPPITAVPFVLKRMLIPLDASPTSAAAVKETLLLGRACGLDMVVLHVYNLESLPMFDDHPEHETRAWVDEFLARNCPHPTEAAIELRVGSARDHVLEVARESGVDLIALGWAQDLSRGRAAVVRKALRISEVPVLLLPLAGAGDPDEITARLEPFSTIGSPGGLTAPR
jgi:nucleotide-binding universal stress UspA family protein